MGEEVRLRGGVGDSGRVGALLRVGATRGLDGVMKRMKESGVFRDAAKILPQTVLLSPRGVFGLSHPGRDESLRETYIGAHRGSQSSPTSSWEPSR